ncbi:hypothetical protein BD770DRAFT_390654 [Pilaira anomala]|nr:hypothetical protein BD770DRAFT_390654 [Pilaira anomala]
MLSLMNPRESSNTVNNKIKHTIPTPYGIIPKRGNNKNKKSAAKQYKNLPIKKTPRNAPYPCFSSLTPTSSSLFISIFNNLFNKQMNEKPVGFMPRSTTNKMSQVIDIVVSSNSNTAEDNNSSDSCSSLSSSSDSSLSSLLSFYMEDDNSSSGICTNNTSDMNDSNSRSTEVLSDILCDHYVQTQLKDNTEEKEEIVRDVPLETFRIFEAPNNSTTKEQQRSEGTSYENYWTIDDEQATKEWKLIETKHPKELEEEKEVIVIAVEEEKEVKEEEESVYMFHARDTRANAAYLRMIVAEVNMMRSEKIVGPLRPRRVLPKRLDKFMHRPSPLQSAY